MSSNSESFLKEAKVFEQLPYKLGNYSGRNWGDPLHSLCSYQGKLKPSIAHFLVTNFTRPGDSVLDPMSGAGTIPLEARLTGRIGIANDLQELGFTLSLAKVSECSSDRLLSELSEFLEYVRDEASKLSDAELEAGDFGLNSPIRDYFHPENLRQVLAGRKYIKLNPCQTSERAMIYSVFYHILHGNRPYALSRNSHPVTPFKPTGEFENKDFFHRMRNKLERARDLNELMEKNTLSGSATLGSFSDLEFSEEIDAVITSPPFAGSTRFYIANWMRLWAAGWNAEDFSLRKSEFIEEIQKKNDFKIYGEFFGDALNWLKPGGKLILHLGKTDKLDMGDELLAHLPTELKLIHRFDESVLGSDKFGIRDQGATKSHQFLFIQKD